MISFKMNKKGDAPMILLALVTLVLVVMMAFIFLTFGGKLAEKSVEYSKVSSGLEFNYQYIISSAKLIIKEAVKGDEGGIEETSFNDRIKSAAEKYNYNLVGQGNLFGKIRNGEFSFADNKLVVNGLFVTYEVGANSAKRVFDLCLQLDNKGEFLSYC
jgi:hypothetical protein